VDAGEMECWSRICRQYDLDRDIRIAARSVSFADAIKTICSSSVTSLGRDLLGDCRDMTISDGFCAHSEALLMIALKILLSPEHGLTGEVYSIPRASFDIDIATAIYVESDDDPETNEAVRRHYRSIFKEFQLTGFHFIYIPKIIEHYSSTDPTLFRDIMRFLAPAKKESDIEESYRKLMEMTTGSYCKDLLCNKCGFTDLRNTPPAILIKIGNSFVGTDRYANYLKIDVDEDILKTVQAFIDEFSEMLSSDVFVVNTSEERGDQFHFHGFYKQLLDIFLIEQKKRSPVEIDLRRQKITFTDLEDSELDLHRKEKAFYIAMLCQGSGGIKFRRPRTPDEIRRYETRMKRFQSRYAAIYSLMGGVPGRVPDVTNATIRNPMMAAIRRAISNLEGLYNPDDYSITKDSEGSYAIHLETSLVFVLSNNEQKRIPLQTSELFEQWNRH
ncbi:MAG: hypothetical protein K2L11_00760, partial [Muribaculaceae bacterium]|nr:hypothetical protein [Muribaculaceae bacterium]